jgi:WD40 repeat protein
MFSADGSAFATASYKAVQVWDANTGAELRSFPFDGSSPHQIAFSVDGKTLAASHKTSIYLWRLNEDKPPTTIEDAHGHETYALCFAPDGQLISAGAGSSRTIQLLDGKFVGTLPSEIRVWNASSGKLVAEFPPVGADSSAYSLALTANGRQLITVHRNKICVWNLTERKVVRADEFFNGSGYAARSKASGCGTWIAAPADWISPARLLIAPCPARGRPTEARWPLLHNPRVSRCGTPRRVNTNGPSASAPIPAAFPRERPFRPMARLSPPPAINPFTGSRALLKCGI